MAGIPVLAAVSAPSSLAAQLAEEAGLTLVGFLRGDSFNVYTRRDRLALPRVATASSDQSDYVSSLVSLNPETPG